VSFFRLSSHHTLFRVHPTDVHGDTLLDSIMSLDARLLQFAEQKAEAEVWWHKRRRGQGGGLAGSNSRGSLLTQQTSGAAAKPAPAPVATSPTIMELAMFSMKGMKVAIEQEKEKEKSEALSHLLNIDPTGLGRLSIRGAISESGSPTRGVASSASGSLRMKLPSQMVGEATSSATAATAAASPPKGGARGKDEAGSCPLTYFISEWLVAFPISMFY